MRYVLLVGGELGGEVVQWPRADGGPCIFPTRQGTTPPYFVYNVLGYWVARPKIHLYPADRILCSQALLRLTSDQLKKIRTDFPEMEASDG